MEKVDLYKLEESIHLRLLMKCHLNFVDLL